MWSEGRQRTNNSKITLKILTSNWKAAKKGQSFFFFSFLQDEVTRLRITSQLRRWAYQLLETDSLTPRLPRGLKLHRVRIYSNCESYILHPRYFSRVQNAEEQQTCWIRRLVCLETEKANNTWSCFQKRSMNMRWDKNEINMIHVVKKEGGKPLEGFTSLQTKTSGSNCKVVSPTSGTHLKSRGTQLSPLDSPLLPQSRPLKSNLWSFYIRLTMFLLKPATVLDNHLKRKVNFLFFAAKWFFLVFSRRQHKTYCANYFYFLNLL